MPENNNNLRLKVLGIIAGMFIFFVSSTSVECRSNYYYYLQVGSFKTIPEALVFSQKLSSINETELIRGEDISDLGYWYRVYLGPFSSFNQASQKRLELRKKGFYAERAFVHQKKTLIRSNVIKEAAQADKRTKIAPDKTAPLPVKSKVNFPPKEQESVKQTPSAALVDCVKKCYYYLQIGSFKTVSKASHFAEPLSVLNERALINGEDVPDLGHWYRVYLGPFPSFQAATRKKIDLQKKGFSAEGAFVHKKKSLIQTNLQQEAEQLDKKVTAIVKKEPVKSISENQAAVLLSQSKRELPLSEEKMPPKTLASAEKPDRRELSEIREVAKTSLAVATPKPHQKPTPAKIMQQGKGRNVHKGALALGLKHAYRETQTELTNRKLITSNSTTTTTQDVSLNNIDKNSFATYSHITTVRARFGLTDSVEIFADIGAAYDKLSDPEPAYGGGVRLNLFEVPVRRLGEFYLALQGEYLGGKYSEEYDSASGVYRWKKDSNWQEFSGKVELGVSRSKFTAYIGGLYFLYKEDTDRNLLQNIPPPNTSYIHQDELQQEYNYGAYGGVSYHFTPALIFNIEGQIINQKSVSSTLEYHF